MKPAIHEIIRRIAGLSLRHQIAHLRALVAEEKPHSVRRNELQSLLEVKLLKQLRAENRRERKYG